MPETINEPVSVLLWSNHKTRHVVPYSISWHGRRYRMTTIGLHHTIWEGRRLFHIFSVSDGTTYFKLMFDTETLAWKLLEVESLN